MLLMDMFSYATPNVPWVAMIRHAQVELSLIFQELRTQERSVMPM